MPGILVKRPIDKAFEASNTIAYRNVVVCFFCFFLVIDKDLSGNDVKKRGRESFLDGEVLVAIEALICPVALEIPLVDCPTMC